MIDKQIGDVDKPIQFEQMQSREISISDLDVDNLVRTSEARTKFKVSGKGLTVAVLDTGIRASHVDFKGRVKHELNFTADYNGDQNNANDKHGHGTNVTGIIAANEEHIGIAPDVEIIAIKVLDNGGGGNFMSVKKALKWILANPKYGISAICMSLGDMGNHLGDINFLNDEIRILLRQLADNKVVSIVAAGNDYFKFHSEQGMAYPAIIRDVISVGAVYDAYEGYFKYQSGAEVMESGPDRITPFSQRLHKTRNPETYTSIFAPGAPVTSSGIANDYGESVQHGTSQAAPVITGIVLLIQERFKNITGRLPSFNMVKEILERGAVSIFDGDDENDNVTPTNLNYRRADAFESLKLINSLIVKQLFIQNVTLNEISL